MNGLSFAPVLSRYMAKNCSKLYKGQYIQCCHYHPDYDIARGQPFKQLYHGFPWLRRAYFDFEMCYDADIILDHMKANQLFIPIISISLYLLFLYWGVQFMKNIKPWKLDKLLAAWNLFLSIASLYMTVRLLPHTLWLMSTKTFEETVCDPAHITAGGGAAGLALQIFILSKLPELLDTVFIILRKKPLIFLHWYHHVTVLILCWYAYITEAGNGYIFAAMNSFVHTVMYFYFFLQSKKWLPKGFPTVIITCIQIFQMLLGTFYTLFTTYIYVYGGKKYKSKECHNHPIYLFMGTIVYSSYLYLFVKFAILRFFYKKSVEELKKML